MEDQHLETEAFAAIYQLRIMQDFSDVGSGVGEEASSSRQNFNAACKLALKRDWPILVTVPSRFTRTIEAYERFVARGGRLICQELGIDASNDAVRSYLLAELVQHEQRQRSAAIGQQRARAEGRYPGNPSLAMAREKSIQVRQAKALRRHEEFEQQLVIARAGGAKTPKAITTAFNRASFKTFQGGRWKEGNVRRIIATLKELKAASGPLSAAEAVPVSNDNVDDIAAVKSTAGFVANISLNREDAKLGVCQTLAAPEAQTGETLSPAELAEFRELLEQSPSPAEKTERLVRQAASSKLTQSARAKIMNWIARKRAA